MDGRSVGCRAAPEPGATADTITSMPSGPEAKVALYEAPFILDDTHAPNDADLGVRTQQLTRGRSRAADRVTAARRREDGRWRGWHA